MIKVDVQTFLGIIANLITFSCSLIFEKYKVFLIIFSLVIAIFLWVYINLRERKKQLEELKIPNNKSDRSDLPNGQKLERLESEKTSKIKRGLLRCSVLLLLVASLVFTLWNIYDLIAVEKGSFGPDNSPTLSASADTMTPTPPSKTETPAPVETTTSSTGEIVDTRPYQGIIAAGYNFTVALREDGTVICIGGDGDIYVENWEGIKQIAAYGYHVLGLFENGKVAFTGKSASGEKEVTSWSGIKQVAACYEGSIGLKEDGTVVYAGFDKNNLSECQRWSGIKRILGGEDHIVGLTNSGNIVTSGYNGGGSGDGRRQDFSFNNVVEGYAASGSTFCVFSDGSVGVYGTDWAGEDMIGGWSNIVAISGGDKHTVGLKGDGTVVAMGSNEFGQCNVKGWSDIIAIYCGQFHTVGLKSDGTLVATGLNDSGQCDVGGIDLW